MSHNGLINQFPSIVLSYPMEIPDHAATLSPSSGPFVDTGAIHSAIGHIERIEISSQIYPGFSYGLLPTTETLQNYHLLKYGTDRHYLRPLEIPGSGDLTAMDFDCTADNIRQIFLSVSNWWLL